MTFRRCRPAALRALAALAALVLGACGGPGGRPAAPAPSSSPAPAAGPSDPPLRGILSAAGDGFAFRACGSPESAARAVSDGREEVGKIWTSLRPGAGRAVYVELRGRVSPDGRSLAVGEILRAHVDGAGSGCERPVFDGEFVASGNAPSWSIEIGTAGIVYRSPSEPKGRSFPYSALRTDSGVIEYATRIDKPKVQTLAVRIEPGRCVDSTSGEIRGFVARAEVDGTKLSGCAAAGVPKGGFGDDPLDELRRYAGVTPREAGLWSIEPWKSRLAALLGVSRGAFEARLQGAGPLMEDGGVYYAIGGKPGAGDGAVFAADPDSDTIDVVLVDHGVRREFKEGDRDVPLPSEARGALGAIDTR